MKKEQAQRQKPFFAAFLENQLSQRTTASVHGGDGSTGVIQDEAQTQKYPSDQEDDGTTKPDWDCILTMKYPSDNDEDANDM